MATFCGFPVCSAIPSDLLPHFSYSFFPGLTFLRKSPSKLLETSGISGNLVRLSSIGLFKGIGFVHFSEWSICFLTLSTTEGLPAEETDGCEGHVSIKTAGSVASSISSSHEAGSFSVTTRSESSCSLIGSNHSSKIWSFGEQKFCVNAKFSEYSV